MLFICSVPLLKLRPRKDLVETLLHEMIHAYLFVTDGNDDHDGHGPAFHEHMFRINKETGTKISVYHNFHDEVDAYRTHWWQCDGPCRQRRPFFGLVKRAMNRAPGPTDRWWSEHLRSCGGTYTKIKEPENYGKKRKKGPAAAAAETSKKIEKLKGQIDIRSFSGVSKPTSERTPLGNLNEKSGGFGGAGAKGNIFGFGGTSFATPGSSQGLQTKGKTGAFVVKSPWQAKDNSSKGHVFNKSPSKVKMPVTSTVTSTGNNDVREQLRKVWSSKSQSCDKNNDKTKENQSTKVQK